MVYIYYQHYNLGVVVFSLKNGAKDRSFVRLLLCKYSFHGHLVIFAFHSLG